MKPFSDIQALASARKGGDRALRALMPEVASATWLADQPDSYYLSTMMRRIFRAGLKHSLVDRKWPAFEQAFFGFDPERLVLMPDSMLDERMLDTRLIRHWGKMKSIRHNAQMVLDVSAEAGGFGRWLGQWPDDDVAGLWLALKKRGSQLGGHSAPAFLRMAGRDTWYPTRDVVAALVAQDIIDKAPSSQRDQRLAQQAFNQWQAESGLPQAHISRTLACTVG
ncbi:MAG: DNA-3-methyladenine glycosylase I [Alcanivoracaceae bacterium]|nr:DNA-3-methyladenine glycosylase I [Alcanivoracaceae bacterium]